MGLIGLMEDDKLENPGQFKNCRYTAKFLSTSRYPSAVPTREGGGFPLLFSKGPDD